MRTNAGMRVCALAMLAALMGLTSAPQGVRAQDRSGVRPEVLSLPDGPGSIEGLGESFEPSASTGTSAYSVPLRVPPGVVGFEPSLALRYSSGAGNGELGLGWSLGLPLVQRGTDEGLPRYDADDRIVLRGMGGGAEDLVQLADGSWRFRIEGAFVRGRQRDDGSWEFRSRSGIRFRFGTTAESLVRDPADPSRVFGWQLTEQLDTHGHVIRYEWERNAAGEPELARIVYNDFSPEVRNVVSFEREARPDVLTSYVSTFPVRTERRIARIVVTHGGRLVRRYELGFSMMLGLSRLTSVRMVGNDGETALPTLSLSYVDFAPERAEVITMQDAPARALGCAGGACEAAELDDVDGDALPDLLITDPALDGGRYSWVPNLDGQRWGSRRTLTSSPSVWLSAAGVQLADMDGDGAADVVARVSGASDGLRFYPAAIDPTHTGEGFASAPVVVRPAMSFSLEDADVRLVDLDHDRRSDVLRIDPTTGEAFVAFNLGEGRFTALESVGRFEPREVLSFSRSRLQLADMNGDGLTDLVALRDGSLRYWPSRGFGRFDALVDIAGAPSLSESEVAAVQVRDLNGDGVADLVHVGVSRVRYWLSLAGSVLMPAESIGGTPEQRPTTVVRVADMNGNGTADVVWIDPASSTPWRYLDVLADGTPGLLQAVENGLGRTTRIGYTSLGAMRGWARAEGIEWTHRSPIGQTVVHSVETETGLDPVVRFELWYASPHYDGAEREFRGFALSTCIDVGDEEQPTLVTETRFDVGIEEEALKGMPLVSERRTEAGGIFDRDVSRYAVRTIATAASGEPIHYAFRDRLDRYVFELTDTPVLVRSEWDHDEHGNVTRESEWGIVEGDDAGAGDDERVTVRTFAVDESTWMLDRVATERVEDEHGQRFAETRTYYDGPAFEGLPLGAVGGFGEVSRAESWIEVERFALESALERDEHGNLVVALDGRGGRSEIEYDPESHTFALAERRFTSDASSLEWRVAYDRAHGQVDWSRDANGHETSIVYDALGRLVSFVLPGDSPDYPTRVFRYEYGSPLSFIREEVRDVEGYETALVSFRYVDASGRTRGEARRADGGRWVIDSLVSFGARGLTRHEAQPSFERSADLPMSGIDERPGTTTLYDALERSIIEREVGGAERRVEHLPLAQRVYDENDTDPSSEHFDTPITYESDGADRLRVIVEHDEGRLVRTRYGYDALDNLVEATDAAGHVRRHVFDGRSRRRRVEDPNAGSWTLDYDDADALVLQRDPEGNELHYHYDLAGRVALEEHVLGATGQRRVSVRYHYDEASPEHPALRNLAGRLAWVEDDAGAVFLGYDARGRGTDRVRRWDDGTEHRTWSDFDSADRLRRRGFPDGTHLGMTYDARGLLERVGPIVRELEWNAASELDSMTLGNGVVDTHHYDARLRAVRFDARSESGVALRDLEYTRDAASRVTAVRDLRPGIAPELDASAIYSFDDRYRLTQSMSSTSVTTWDHDDVGNILWHERDGARVEHVYGEDGHGPDQLTHLGDEELVYDRAGRVVRDGERELEWDAEGRLSRVTRGDVVEEHVYGYDDERAVRIVRRGRHVTELVRTIDGDAEERDGRLVRYVEVSGRRVARLDGALANSVVEAGAVSTSGALSVLLLWLLALAARSRPALWRLLFASATLLAACDVGAGHDPRETSVAIDELPPGTEFYLADIRNTSSTLAGAAAQVTEERRFSAYGAREYGVVTRGADTRPDVFGFLGAEHAEGGSGLALVGARPYREDAGIFLAPDPIAVLGPEVALDRPATLYPYLYGAADPVNHTDASGLLIDTIADAAFITLDIGILMHDINTGADSTTVSFDAAILIIDVACAMVPLVTGGGAAVRAGEALWASQRATQAATHTTQASVHSTQAATHTTTTTAVHGSGAATQGATAETHYSRDLYGGSGATRGKAAREVRQGAEGRACPDCGEKMRKGVDGRRPIPDHDPSLRRHYDEGAATSQPGRDMTQAERETYARSREAFRSDGGAHCETCSRKQGGRESQASRAAARARATEGGGVI
jgi:RHS repeat-associated protein